MPYIYHTSCHPRDVAPSPGHGRRRGSSNRCFTPPERLCAAVRVAEGTIAQTASMISVSIVTGRGAAGCLGHGPQRPGLVGGGASY